RNDRLNVEHFLGALEWPSVEVRVALERNTDHIGDWILRLFRQVFVRRLGRSSSSTRPFDRIGNAALELIIQTEFDHLNVAVQLYRRDRGRSPVRQQNLIVFELDRPMRFEAILDAGSEQQTGPGAGVVPTGAGKVHRGTAVHPAPAQLAIEKPTI